MPLKSIRFWEGKTNDDARARRPAYDRWIYCFDGGSEHIVFLVAENGCDVGITAVFSLGSEGMQYEIRAYG